MSPLTNVVFIQPQYSPATLHSSTLISLSFFLLPSINSHDKALRPTIPNL